MSTTPKSFLIEASHSRWGAVKLKAELQVDPPTGNWPEEYKQYIFSYPSGEYMGSLDQDGGGGGLGHPDERVDEFMQFYSIDRADYDSEAYCELERILLMEINRNDPEFLNPDAREVLDSEYRASVVQANFICTDPDGKVVAFVLHKLPSGFWWPFHAETQKLAIRGELEDMDLLPFSKRGFASPWQLKQKLEKKGYRDFTEIVEGKPEVNRLATF